jgi:O-succinylbenzoate synthase
LLDASKPQGRACLTVMRQSGEIRARIAFVGYPCAVRGESRACAVEIVAASQNRVCI